MGNGLGMAVTDMDMSYIEDGVLGVVEKCLLFLGQVSERGCTGFGILWQAGSII